MPRHVHHWVAVSDWFCSKRTKGGEECSRGHCTIGCEGCWSARCAEHKPRAYKPASRCVIGRKCKKHGYVHGKEAEELRKELEKLDNPEVQRILERVDARDSLAYLEARRR